MNLRPIFFVNGVLLITLAIAMLAPMMADLATQNKDWRVFAGAQIITAFFGFLLISANRQKEFSITQRELILMSASGWIFAATFAAIPFWLSDIRLPYSHAFFEAMSGITTTGSTVISGLDTAPAGILIWRALLQWLGGLGFLITALSILPALQVGGMQVFKTQSADLDKVMPSTTRVLFYIGLIYAALTFCVTFLLNAAGLNGFDALIHAMTAISTGGFSTKDASVGAFDSGLIEGILCLGMILGALPFALYLRAARGNAKSLLDDSQVKTFLSLMVFFTVIFSSYLAMTTGLNPIEALRHAGFKTVSLLTTTGFVSGSDVLWGPFAVGMAFLAAFIGGCSGSTAGGLKIFRLQILCSMVGLHIKKICTPNGLFQAHYAGKPVDNSIQSAVGTFFFIYAATFIITNALLMFTGLSFWASFVSTASAIGNIGPSLSHPVIPDLHFFSILPPQALWILSGAMLLGRLEFLILLVLLAPQFWRR